MVVMSKRYHPSVIVYPFALLDRSLGLFVSFFKIQLFLLMVSYLLFPFQLLLAQRCSGASGWN